MTEKVSETSFLEQKIKIKRERLYDQVVRQIQESIINGGLKPGDKLPAERQLAEQLGISRIVIREAMKTLEERGLVKVMSGSGTYVSQADPQMISQSIGLLVHQSTSSFDHLNEVRRMLEIEIAGLAAERATAEDIEALDDALHEMEIVIADLSEHPERFEDYVEVDLAFHNTLAKATQNPLLLVLLEPISDLLLELRRVASSAPGALEDAVTGHRRILDQVRARNVSGSREAMRAHLEKARERASRADGSQIDRQG